MAQAEAERVSRYKDLTVEQINKMSADATKKLGELNNTFEEIGKSGIYDTSAMPEWMRTEYEHSGKSLEEYFDSQIANTEQLIEDLAAAREDAKTEFEKTAKAGDLAAISATTLQSSRKKRQRSTFPLWQRVLTMLQFR